MDYLFFVAARTQLGPTASGLVVLKSAAGPNPTGQWSLDFALSYGLYQPFGQPGDRNGPVFATAMAHLSCPTATQDPTFDLNYTAPWWLTPRIPGT